MTLPRLISLIAAALLVGPLCHAQSDTTQRKQYHVEVITFQYNGPDSSAGESFDRLQVESYLPGTGFDTNEYNRLRELVSYTELTELTRTLGRLRDSPRYTVLTASAWVQPLLSRSEAVDVPLGDSPVSTGSSASRSGPRQLSGFVRIHGGRLLFADMNLRLTAPRQPGDETAPQRSAGESADDGAGFGRTRLDDNRPRSYRIAERRRIKLEEIHYFDHPHIGAILIVRRYNPGSG